MSRKLNWIEVFKAGTHTDSSGLEQSFSEKDLRDIVKNFDAEVSAPAVIGHPKSDDPAWGWVDKLKVESGKLLANFRQLVPAFVEAVQKGRYRKISVKLRQADEGAGWQLIHVGFLGAAAPAVGGLKPAAFEEREGDLVLESEFALEAQEASALRRLWRGIRDWMIEKHGLETADRVLPEYEIEQLQPPAAMEPGFNESNGSDLEKEMPEKTAGNGLTEERVAEMMNGAVEKTTNDLTAEFTKKEAAMNARIEELNQASRRRDITAFAEEQVRDGRLAPKALERGLVEFMLGLEAANEVEFAVETKQTPLIWFQEFIKAQPESPLFGQMGGGKDDPGPAGDEEAQTKAISEFIAAEKKEGREVSFSDAVKKVAAKNPELFPI